jgi:hypothetical protein
MNSFRLRRWLIAVVLAHLAVCAIHGAAHEEGGVPLSTASTAFVLAVVIVAPLGGLLLLRVSYGLGGAVVAVSMGASLLFGLLNHFILPGADNALHVAAAARSRFAISALLLAVTEACGAALGAWVALEQRQRLVEKGRV